MASNVVRDKLDSAKEKKVTLATHCPTKPMTLSEQKPPSRVKALYSDKPIPASELKKMMQVNNMSLNQVKKQSFMIRTWQGRNSIEPRTLNTLVEMDRTLQPFFKSQDVELEGHKNTLVKRSITYCHDVNGVIQHIKETRGYSSESTLRSKIGIDSGGDFLKVCLNLDVVDSDNSPKKKAKFAYKEGACASEFKDSGVKKIIILAIVENVTESHGNLKIILDLLGIQNIDCVHAMDMKAANAFIGIGTASSTFPCTWCEMKKSEFGNEEFLFTGGNLRTLGSIRKNAQEYQLALQGHKGRTKLSSAQQLNCEHPPLCYKEDSTVVLHVIPPMELHIMLGIVNRLYDHLNNKLEQIGSKHSAYDWSDKLGMARKKHHGGEFDGKQCSLLLKNVNILFEVLDIEDINNEDIANAIDALKATSVVKEACFGKELDPNYKQIITDFGIAYMKLGISVTPKVHAILVHVCQFLEIHEGNGLGPWSEQASESVHFDFSQLWEKGCYKRSLNHDQYADKLLKCVITYNSRHV